MPPSGATKVMTTDVPAVAAGRSAGQVAVRIRHREGERRAAGLVHGEHAAGIGRRARSVTFSSTSRSAKVSR